MTLANVQWQRYLFLLLGVSLFCSMPPQLSAQEAKATQTALDKVANESTVELTTTGRKSGKSHTKPIWFVYDQGHLYLQAGKGGKTDWYQNLKKNPQMTLKIADVTLKGTAKFIDDAQETERIHELFRQKYVTARVLGAVGSSIGHGKTVEVQVEGQ
jgi:deazaflavin-dependent oxidoreductase (nitroreductase family)